MKKAIIKISSYDPADPIPTPYDSWFVVPLISTFALVEHDGEGHCSVFITVGNGNVTLGYKFKRDAQKTVDDIQLAIDEYYGNGE